MWEIWINKQKLSKENVRDADLRHCIELHLCLLLSKGGWKLVVHDCRCCSGMFWREEPAASRVLKGTHNGNRLVPLKMARSKHIWTHSFKWDNLTWSSIPIYWLCPVDKWTVPTFLMHLQQLWVGNAIHMVDL